MSAYNGWTNYETWLVNLWIDNDGMDDYWLEQATECLQRDNDTDTIIRLSERLKDSFDESANETLGTSGLFTDLLQSALSQVDWREIAEHMIEAANEEIKAQDGVQSWTNSSST